MTKISQDSIATLQFELNWLSDVAKHKDIILAEPVNFWRDLLPEPLAQALKRSTAGDELFFSFPPGQVIPGYESKNRFKVKNQQFERRKLNDHRIEPRRGRFYPKGLLQGIPGVFSNNVVPFRCANVTPSQANNGVRSSFLTSN